ncbi:hypothetical protein CGLO_14331 [Colletotrichum gloeosporioides Cg-14]|uniref:Uncharacterized protein n=1 Tax=Colletotrichum gloeosporioides (strain Cg-14) TaxID=1237896 RepID=T0JUI0_COLGC|nr:hypothetical protein CGLO_14331 [Colletotrichum gloeosporioides Cg-14]
MSYQNPNALLEVSGRGCPCDGFAGGCSAQGLKNAIGLSITRVNDDAALNYAASCCQELLKTLCSNGMEPMFLERDHRCRFVGSLLPDLLDQRCSAQVFEVFLRYTGYVDLKHPDTLGILQVIVERLLWMDLCEENKLDEHSRLKIDLILLAISSRFDGADPRSERQLTFNRIKPWLINRCRWAAYPPMASYPPSAHFPAFLGLLDAMISCFWDNRHRDNQSNILSRTIYDDAFWFSLLEMLWTDQRVINGTMCRVVDISRRLLHIGKEIKERGMCADRDPFTKRNFLTEGRRGWKLRNLVKELRDGAKGHKDRRIAADWSDDVEVGFRIVGENQGRINFDNQAARMRKNSWLEMGRLVRS